MNGMNHFLKSLITFIVYQVLGPLNKENRGCATRGMVVA